MAEFKKVETIQTPVGKINDVEKQKSNRDGHIQIVSLLFVGILQSVIAFLTGEELSEYLTSNLGVFATVAQTAIQAYVLPRLNRILNILRV